MFKNKKTFVGPASFFGPVGLFMALWVFLLPLRVVFTAPGGFFVGPASFLLALGFLLASQVFLLASQVFFTKTWPRNLTGLTTANFYVRGCICYKWYSANINSHIYSKIKILQHNNASCKCWRKKIGIIDWYCWFPLQVMGYICWKRNIWQNRL